MLVRFVLAGEFGRLDFSQDWSDSTATVKQKAQLRVKGHWDDFISGSVAINGCTIN